MAYILTKDLPDSQSLAYFDKRQQAWEQYRHHLRSAKRLPPKALEFALAEWHYDSEDHRCPHDAWLESLTIEEGPEQAQVHERSMRIVVVLLGAYHDGHLRIEYTNVRAYSFDLPSPYQARPHETGSQGDWSIDEIRSPGHRGRVIHEIEWIGGAHWIIEAGEIEVTWIPLSAPPD
jgi:hypothetical protein